MGPQTDQISKTCFIKPGSDLITIPTALLKNFCGDISLYSSTEITFFIIRKNRLQDNYRSA